MANRKTPGSRLLTEDELYRGCRLQTSHKLGSLEQRIEPRLGLKPEDLILPPANARQFQELRARIHFRSRLLTDLGFEQRFQLGKGLIALFTGSSGTGKTMAAELLALDLGVDVYRVDLSAVVCQYRRYTEKQP